MNHEPHFHFGLVSVEEGVRNEPLVMETYIMYFDKHHFNMENRFVIHPDKTIIAVPCNNQCAVYIVSVLCTLVEATSLLLLAIPRKGECEH
jgi:hypothetical protein